MRSQDRSKILPVIGTLNLEDGRSEKLECSKNSRLPGVVAADEDVELTQPFDLDML